jgi:hypothetical protein
MRSSRVLLLAATALLLPLTSVTAAAVAADPATASASDAKTVDLIGRVLETKSARDSVADVHKVALDAIDAESKALAEANKAEKAEAEAAVEKAATDEAKAAAKAAVAELQRKHTQATQAIAAKRRAKVAEQTAALKPLNDALNELFRGVPLAAWDLSIHGAMVYDLANGWMTELVRKPGQPDIKKAAEVAEYLLDKQASFPKADGLATNWVVWSAISGANVSAAKARLEKMIPAAAEKDKAGLQLWLGDVSAAMGDYAAAQKTYAEVEAGLPPAPTKEAIAAAQAAGQRPPADPAGRTRSDVALRLKFVGKDVPTLASDTWFGAGRTVKSLADYKGKVVLLDYWATW